MIETFDNAFGGPLSLQEASKENQSFTANWENEKKKERQMGDRFIPLRENDYWNRKVLTNSAGNKKNEHVKRLLLNPDNEKSNGRILRFNPCHRKKKDIYDEGITEIGLRRAAGKRSVRSKRTLPKRAEKVLDAPGLINDYYLNLIDWGINNLLAVCLGEGAFVWNPVTQEGSQFFSSTNSLMFPTSISWAPKADNMIAIGFSNSHVHIRDFSRNVLVREIDDHWARVSAVTWNPYHTNIFTTSSKDCEIINYDMRVQRSTQVCKGHTQEVCGLKWSPDGSLLASGGNDNALLIWDPRKDGKPLHEFREHKAAVKALAWCPWQKNVIVSGGGSSDKTIKFWRVDEGKLKASHNISSQVCGLLWNPRDKELLSAHGYSQFQLSLWKYPNMQKVGDLFGHKDRVLHLALSPDHSTIVSAGADETLRFWKIFDVSKDSENSSHKSLLTPLNIR